MVGVLYVRTWLDCWCAGGSNNLGGSSQLMENLTRATFLRGCLIILSASLHSRHGRWSEYCTYAVYASWIVGVLVVPIIWAGVRS